MTLTSYSSTSISWLAVTAGVVQLIGVVFLVVFFAIGEPFGTLNDICIALTAVLSTALAWRLLAALAPALGWLALGAAVVGALIVVVGQSLVIFHITTFVLAGFWAQFGYAVIGLWLLATCLSFQGSAGLPR